MVFVILAYKKVVWMVGRQKLPITMIISQLQSQNDQMITIDKAHNKIYSGFFLYQILKNPVHNTNEKPSTSNCFPLIS